MNDTAQIDTELYGCYYVYESLDAFKLYRRYPDGDMEYTEYDTFSADDKTIIAFKDFNIGRVEYNYVLVSNGRESIVQWATYESIYPQFNQKQINTDDVYTFLNSVSIPNLMASSHIPTIVSYEKRCDTDSYGIMPYAITDGVKTSVTDPGVVNGQNIKALIPLLSVCGISHIEYFKIEGVGTSYQDWPAVSGMTKTFMGAMKLIVEWASLAAEPFDLNDEIIIDAKNFLEKLELGQDVIDEISEHQEDMPVYRYLKNATNARTGFEETTTISPLLNSWLRKNLRYASLNSLVAQHPEQINIDSAVLQTEKIAIEEKIYKYCAFLEINDENITPEEVLEAVQYSNTCNPQKLSDSDTYRAKKALFSYMAYN
jgi:hypothetical protein